MSSEEKEQEDKTEEPTSKRLQDAHERGQVAKSREFNSLAILLVGALSFTFVIPLISLDIMSMFTRLLANVDKVRIDDTSFQQLLSDGLQGVGTIMGVYFIVTLLASALSNLVQHGLVFSVKPLQPQLQRISLVKNLKQKLSMQHMLEFLKGVFKIIIVFVVGGVVLLPLFDFLPKYLEMTLVDFTTEMLFYLILLFIGILILMLGVSFLDILFQRFNHRKQLRMTKQELKEEYKNMEGDPQVKARLHKIRMERARRRMMDSVPNADVVITNPTHYAVVLKYDQTTMMAPVVVAKGQDFIALRIKDIAHDNDVAVVENPPLARGLFAAAEIDDEIPEEFFEPVAQIIRYVWELNKRAA